jgi:futalosine hydrolase
MAFKILYVTATSTEAETLKNILGELPDGEGVGKLEINYLVTGVGSMATLWVFNEWLAVNGKPNLAINGGIAGSYNDQIVIGDVVMPITDCFADSGIEDSNDFFTLFEAGLADENEFPFRGGLLYSDSRYNDKMKSILIPVKAITLNSATGSETTRLKLVKKYKPDIETMEGATFFYICRRKNIPFISLRAISNKVEKRDKNNWNISLALNNLSKKLIEVILTAVKI